MAPSTPAARAAERAPENRRPVTTVVGTPAARRRRTAAMSASTMVPSVRTRVPSRSIARSFNQRQDNAASPIWSARESTPPGWICRGKCLVGAARDGFALDRSPARCLHPVMVSGDGAARGTRRRIQITWHPRKLAVTAELDGRNAGLADALWAALPYRRLQGHALVAGHHLYHVTPAHELLHLRADHRVDRRAVPDGTVFCSQLQHLGIKYGELTEPMGATPIGRVVPEDA